MNKDDLLPRFRFAEFKDDETWIEQSLEQISKINPPTSSLPESFIYIDLESVEDGVLLQKKKIMLEHAPSRAQRLLKKGDIIYQMVRPYQKNNYFFDIDDKLNYVASTGYAQLRADQTPMYLFQYLHYQKFVDKVLEKSTGSNYPAIKSTDLAKITVWTSSEKEQQKIADCLSSLDELIAAHTEKLSALKAHKKGLMQQLFPAEGETVPKLRFKEFKESGDWEEKRLKDILKDVTLGGNYENTSASDGIPVIKMGNLERGNFNIENLQYLDNSAEYADQDILKKDDLLLNTRNTLQLVGKVAIWREEIKKALYNSNLLRLTFYDKSVATNHFINYSFNTQPMLRQIRSIATGTTSVAAIYTKDLLKMKVLLPEPKEQQKIAYCLSSLDNLITSQTKKIAGLKGHKKGLMQGLFPKPTN